MSSKYYLPCSCGNKIAIQVSQSGQTVDCACGRRLDVPTLLQIRSLEPVEDDGPDTPRSRWGVRQALFLLGGIIALFGAALAVQQFLDRPVPLVSRSAEQLKQQRIERLSLLQTFQEWEGLQKGLNQNMADFVDETYAKAQAAYRNWMAVALVIVLLGIGFAVAGLLLPTSGPPPVDETEPVDEKQPPATEEPPE